MAFTFDHTLSGVDSNSYVPLDTYVEPTTSHTVIGANDYFDGHPKQEKWTSLTDTEKQQYLARATSRLDMERFGGTVAVSTQRLQFPRQWIIDRDHDQQEDVIEFVDGQYYRSDKYNPLELQYATFEMALYYIEEWLLEEPMFSRQDQERMSQIKIGPLSASLRKAKEDELPDTVKRLLREIGPNGWMGQRAIKLVRS